MAKRPASSSVSSPTVRVRPEISARASALGWNASLSAAARTRLRVAGATSPRPLSAFDAVATETPAKVATSASVVWVRGLATKILSGNVSVVDTSLTRRLRSIRRKRFR